MVGVILPAVATRAYPARMNLPERLLAAVESDPAMPEPQRQVVRTVISQYRATQQAADRHAQRLRAWWRLFLPAGAGAWETVGRLSALQTVLETFAGPYLPVTREKLPTRR